MSDNPIMPCQWCGKHACICAPTYASDSSGKPLFTDLSPERAAGQGYQKGFQAGLKRGAEIAHNWGEAANHQADYDFSNTAKIIEQVILKEAK